MQKDLIELLTGRFDFIGGCIIECKDGWLELIWKLCEELENQSHKPMTFKRTGGMLTLDPSDVDIDASIMEDLQGKSRRKCEYCGSDGNQIEIEDDVWTLCRYHAKTKKRSRNLIECPNCNELISYSRRESSNSRQRKTCPYCKKKVEMARIGKIKVVKKHRINIIDELDKQILELIADHFIASRIGKKLGISKSVISKHISKMEKMGLLRERGIKQKYYQVDAGKLALAGMNEEKPRSRSKIPELLKFNHDNNSDKDENWSNFITADKT